MEPRRQRSVVVIDSIMLGAGLGMLFPVLAAVGFSGLRREQMGDAASLFNLMRNTGAAMGISYLTNMLVSYEQVHQSRLVEHLSVFDAWRLSQRGLLMPGSPPFHFMGQLVTGQKQGLGMSVRDGDVASRNFVVRRPVPDHGRVDARDGAGVSRAEARPEAGPDPGHDRARRIASPDGSSSTDRGGARRARHSRRTSGWSRWP